MVDVIDVCLRVVGMACGGWLPTGWVEDLMCRDRGGVNQSAGTSLSFRGGDKVLSNVQPTESEWLGSNDIWGKRERRVII